MSAKPWLTPDAQAGSYALGLLGLEERKLLYQLARYVYTGEGAVVELGAFCGASTCCLAAGLRDNPRAAGNRLHSYDCFIANEQYLVDFIWTQFDEAVEMGQSFAAIFRRVTAEFVDLIEVHTGDLLEESWPSEKPIEILFVDVAKTLALSGKVLNEIVPHLIPGKSIVIHQDFYHPTAFYLPVVMDSSWTISPSSKRVAIGRQRSGSKRRFRRTNCVFSAFTNSLSPSNRLLFGI